VIEKVIELIKEKIKIKYIGENYYFYKPIKDDYIIKSRKIKLIYTNWFKFLVNQKIDYSLAKPVTFDDGVPEEFDIQDILNQMSLCTSLNSCSWLHFVIRSSKLDWVIIHDAQIIPVYDIYKKYITEIIRFWKLDDKKDENKYWVQLWDAEKCIEFKLIDWQIVDVEEKTHYLEKLKYQDNEEVVNPKSFGFIPFIPLFNNKNKESDVIDIQQLLDVYNQIATGFIDNVYEFQDAILKLKGFHGQDFEQFMKQLRIFKVVPIDGEGDIEKLTIDIPVEARKVLLDLLTKNIFIIGRGVDPEQDFGGGNITNVLIKSIYSGLDTKASEHENQLRLFYKQLVHILRLYYNKNIDNTIVFNRSQLFNESEMIDNCLKSMNMVSMKTVLENHPWISNVDDELEQIKTESKVNKTTDDSDI